MTVMRQDMRKFSDWTQIGCDLVLLNLLWLACCLPIVTAGAATAAMHAVARKMAAGEHYTVWSGFWSAFRADGKQATLLWGLLAVFALACGADLYIGSYTGGGLGLVCQIIGGLGLVLAVWVGTLAFPLLARYTQRLPALLKNAAVLSLANPHIVLAGCAAALVFPALVLLNEHFLILATPGWLLLGGGLPALTVQLLLRPVYIRLEKTKPMEDISHGDCETETHL